MSSNLTKLRREEKRTRTEPSPPVVSILICIYNGQNSLEAALKSVQAQTFQDIEVIAVDDASTDKTPAILRRWRQHLDAQLRILTNEHNIGLTKSLNKALAKARGRYIARLDADDSWHPDKLAKQVQLLLDNPDIGVVGSWYANLRYGTQSITRLPQQDDQIRRLIYRLNPFGHSCVVIRKKLLQQVNGYNPAIRYGQDRDLWFRLLPHTSFHNIPQVLCMRSATTGLSQQHTREQMWQGVKTRLKYIRRDNAPLINYLYLLEPLTVALMPAAIRKTIHYIRATVLFRSIKHKSSSYQLQTTRYQLLFINDRPLKTNRAETVARQHMARAFAANRNISQVTIRTIRPWQAAYTSLPASHTMIYMRCGAVAAALISLRNILSQRTLMLEVHNFAYGRDPLADALYRFAARRCDLLITISDDTKQNWVQAGLAPYKIITLPSGVDIQAFQRIGASKTVLRRQLNLPRGKKLAVYAGNLYRDRGIEDIIAAASLLKNDSHIHICIVGGTPADVAYYRRYRGHHYSAADNLTFIGHQPHKTIPRYLKAADCALITYSRQCPTLHTMSPLKLLEAIAANIPVIAADVPRLRHIVSGRTATFYQLDNARSLAHAIRTTLSDQSTAQHKADEAFRQIQPYAWPHRAAAIINHIETAAS